jgi:GNAT superfamily N-acetyltransferase
MKIKIATVNDADTLLPFIRAYHEFEGIEASDMERTDAIAPLLGETPQFGRIWLIEDESQIIGYIALCFGYSIEFGGRDAFLDEFYIAEPARGRGVGRRVLEEIKGEAAQFGVRAMHLEVAGANSAAKQFYSQLGFASREHFHLMSCELGAVPGAE